MQAPTQRLPKQIKKLIEKYFVNFVSIDSIFDNFVPHNGYNNIHTQQVHIYCRIDQVSLHKDQCTILNLFY